MLNVLTGLGNGYDISKSTKPLLIGGGVGVPPMYFLAKKLIESGQRPCVVLGFNTKDEVFYENEFKALGVDVFVATVDGSYGVKGFVTDAFPDDYDYFIPVALSLCLRRFMTKRNAQVSSRLRKEWAVALVPVWVAPAKQNTAISVYVRTVPFLLRRRLYGRFNCKSCRA